MLKNENNEYKKGKKDAILTNHLNGTCLGEYNNQNKDNYTEFLNL